MYTCHPDRYRHAIIKYGILKGGLLALIRISKCHPFHPGGCDPLV
ncbi:MAG: membrane protein insertion efficiency factor YidD [Deltaproteobacteria bacterium]|nr:membrane protein insertion efficiency factor YidD [Deltaproteobacteria bacterium]